MKSVRLDSEVEKQLERAADVAGVSESEFIRQAIRRQADEVLGGSLDTRLADVVGTVRSKGARARRAHDQFRDLLKKERQRRRS
jgi:Arc/MetJ-type ribon-helix-helix transcriptional regulator